MKARPRQTLVFIALIIAYAPAVAGAAAPLFKAPAMLFDIGEGSGTAAAPYGDQRFPAHVGDLNGDGKADVVVANIWSPGGGNGTTISVLLSRNGSPGLPTLFSPQALYTVGAVPGVLAVTDLDGDGDADVLACADSSLISFLGNGTGSLPTSVVTHILTTFVGPVGDLNGDGRPDMVCSGNGPKQTYLGTGSGSFTLGPVSAARFIPFLLADLNGDAKLDLIGHTLTADDSTMVALGNGDGSFQVPIFVGTSTAYDFWVGVGDFDSDAVPDLVVEGTAFSGPVVTIYHGNGTGTFSAGPTTTLPESWANGLAVGDVDGDGKLDVVVSNSLVSAFTLSEGANTLDVLFGNGTGNFPTIKQFDGGLNMAGPIVADFDGDGLKDIAATNYLDFYPGNSGAHALSVLLNRGGRDFGGGTHLATGREPDHKAVVDLNRDGYPDLLLSLADAQFESHRGDGTGNFGGPIVTPTTPSNSPGPFAVGDLNRDGFVDVVGSGVNILYGLGTGGFSTGGPVGSSGVVTDESLVDLNRDGILDLLLLDGSAVKVALGQPGGTFAAAVSYGTGPSPNDLTTGDWNRDGKADVAVVTLGGISFFLGNGDGTLSAATTIEPFRAFTKITSGDFNRDGKLDIATRDQAPGGGPADAGGFSIFLGDGAGGFGPRQSYKTFDRGGNSIASWDVNRDGSPDIVEGNRQHIDGALGDSDFHSASVWLGNGAGTFAQDATYLTGVNLDYDEPAVGDVNRDGQPDILGFSFDWLDDDVHVQSYLEILRGNAPPIVAGFSGHTEVASASAGPIDPVLADFNRDGILDAAVLAPGGNAVSVHLGTGFGSLNGGTSYFVGPFGEALVAADVNRDGSIDLVSASGGDVVVLLGNGSGGFGAVSTYPVGSDIVGVALGDMNGDGKLDAVVASTGDGAVNVSLGNGAGGFGAGTQFSVSGIPGQIALGDLDRDGDLDVVTFDRNSGDLVVLMGNGTGGLVGESTFSFGAGTRDIAMGDWNMDGALDVVMTRVNGSGFVTFAFGFGDGSFAAPSDYPASSTVQRLFVGDWNVDGVEDIAVGNGAAGTVSLYRGLGNGGFFFAANFTAAGAPVGVASGDLDRDGRPDLVSANSTANHISILLGSDATLTGVVADEAPSAPGWLGQNRPNPFNPRTRIDFTLSRGGPVRLTVFDVGGRRVATLVNRELPSGAHHVDWLGRTDAGPAAASGVYFYAIEAPSLHDRRKMILLK